MQGKRWLLAYKPQLYRVYMLDGLSWAEQMELEEQLAEAQGTVWYVQAKDGCEHKPQLYIVYMLDGLSWAEQMELEEQLAEAHTVRKMGLMLRSIERMLKMQFSMTPKFMLEPLRRYDVKPPKKNRTSVIFRLTCHAMRKHSTGGARSSNLWIWSL
jgi:hypothetical protein